MDPSIGPTAVQEISQNKKLLKKLAHENAKHIVERHTLKEESAKLHNKVNGYNKNRQSGTSRVTLSTNTKVPTPVTQLEVETNPGKDMRSMEKVDNI